MPAVDFGEWAAEDLELAFGGRTYMVRPPSVDAAKQIIAAAVAGEVRLGLVLGEVPAEVTEVLATIGDSHPALGAEVYEQMRADGVPDATVNRMSAYATFYWARGKAYADWLAEVMWKHAEVPTVEATPAPKAQPTSPRPSGRSTGSANPSTTTRTGSRSSGTTGSRRKS